MDKYVGRYDPRQKKVVWDDGKEPVDNSDGGRPQVSTAYSRPLKSMAMSCHPEQVDEFNRHAANGVRYENDGTCYIESRTARNEELKSRGFTDRDGGYGDHC